jgi:filamentous hemagglutinin family protein
VSQHYWNALLLIIGSVLGALGVARPIVAQVISDDTLPVGERSQVSSDRNFQVDGGARRGGNLFHSFSQLSVPTGGSVYFNNAADVQTIFSRVTGGSVSSIDGLIRANGTADLFLLNPNGILFGPNGALDIGGSFVATTANRINFADGFEYSATNSQTAPLLTLSAPVGLQMGANSGRIEVQGNGYDLSVFVPIFTPLIRGNNPAGLQVLTGQTLALVGGDITIDGSTLTAEQGHIELGSVRDGPVSLTATPSGFAFEYQGSRRFGDIHLTQQALVDASGGGLIQVQGNRVSLVDGSLVVVQNEETQSGGSIRVNAAQSLALSGSDPGGRWYGGLFNENAGAGRGADITVSTQYLTAQGGAGIVTHSYSSGNAGNVVVNASDSIQVIGFSPINPTLSSAIGSGSFDSGDGGAVTVSTGQLSLLRGAIVITAAFGNGKAGNVTVNATRAVEIIGVTDFLVQSAIGSTAVTAGVGDAGAVTINTARLVLQNGGAVNSSTVGTGNGGSVTVNASEFVEVSGIVPGASSFSYIGSAAPIVAESIQQALQLPDRSSGNSGSVTINTSRLSISDGANATVSNNGTGNAGTLRVNANSIFVDSQGSLTAATASGEGGDIELNVRDFLLLRNNGQITTSAGGNGNGGNITITSPFLIAFSVENSDIRANSANARGGNISINTDGIFGIHPRSQDTPLSDITSTGVNSAASGTVQLNIDQLNPTFGLGDLPANLIDPSRLIAQGCLASQGNSFVVTGRGGLPPNPEQQLDDDADWQDRRQLVVAWPALSESGNPPPNASMSDGRRSNPPLIEVTALQVTPSGSIRLVGPAAAAHDPLSLAVACQGS